MTTSNSPYRDWLEADDSYLPTNQLPLLRSMLEKRLTNIRRLIYASPDTWIEKGLSERQDFFRKALGTTIVELDGLPPIYFIDSYSYALDFDEYSIAISIAPEHGVRDKFPGYQWYTLLDDQYVDDCLRNVIGRQISKMQILIRTVEHHKDTPRALQDGIRIDFDNGTTIILSYMLDEEGVDNLCMLYPDEVRWEAVQYKIDVAKGRIPALYRLRRWWWRALDRAGRRFERN